MNPERQNHLLEVQHQLQELIDNLTDALETENWNDVAELDMRVNRLAHECVNHGHINEPVIHGKVMALVSLYRKVIGQLNRQKDVIYQSWQQEKQHQKAQNLYQSSSSAIA